MEVNNKTLSEQNEPSAEETADKIETAHETVESGEQNEPAEQKEPSEILQVGDRPRYYGPNALPKRKNGKFTSRKRFNRLANLFKRKSVDPSPTTETVESTERIEPPEPPEQWTTRRLRQNGRELVRNRIKADADYELSVKLENTRERSRIAKQRSRLQRLQQQNDFPALNFVKVEENIDEISVKLENARERDRIEKQRSRLQRLQQQKGFPALNFVKVKENIDDTDVKIEICRRHSGPETPEERSLRLERLRIKRANETAEQRFARIECVKKGNLERLVRETEKERKKRRERHRAARRRRYWREKNLKTARIKKEGNQVDIAVKVSSTETPEQRSLRLERYRIKRANETAEERFARNERAKMAKLKRLVMETVEERSKRLEQQRTAQRRRYWRIRFLREAKDQQAPRQPTELSDFVPESTEEGTEEFILPSESPTQTYAATISAQLNEETNFDVVYNLIHSICRKQHSHRHKQLKIFDKPCESPSSNYILSAVVWHKLNDRTLTPAFPLHEEALQHQIAGQIDKDLNAENCRSKENGTRTRTHKTAQRKKMAYKARTKEEKAKRSDRLKMQRAAETEEQKSMRLERTRMKLAAETDEQRAKRLEGMRRRGKLKYWRKKCLKADC